MSALSRSSCGSCELISFRYDCEIKSDADDADDVIISATRRRHKKSASHTPLRSSENALTHTEEPQNVSEGRCRRTNTSENPEAFSTPACTPRSDITSGKERSEIQQQSRPKALSGAQDKPGILRLSSPNRKRLEPDTTAGIPDEVGRTAEILSAQPHQSPKRRRLESTTPPGGANEARQADSVVQSSSNQLHSSSIQARVVSDIPTKAANEARQNLTTASTSSVHSSPITDTSKMSINANKQSETTLWISIPSSADAVPVKLRSCMTITALFDAVFKICGLAEPEQQRMVLGLRTSLVWMDRTGVKKYMMLKREFEDCFETFLEFIDTSPCWEKDQCCSVGIEPVMTEST